MQNQLGSIWGEYCVEVVRSGGANYYPFGEKPIKNLILDSFFQRILSFTGFPHGIETLVGACVTSTGIGIPASKSGTGLHGLANDHTRASSGFFREIITGENRIRMTRDFNFRTLTGERTYGEASVGMIGLADPGFTVFMPDMPVSHFVFPGIIQLSGGDSLKIIYSLNLIIDYLVTGQRISLTGDGFNFDGTLKWAGNVPLIFSYPEGDGALNSGIHTFLGGAGGTSSYRHRQFQNQTADIVTTNFSQTTTVNRATINTLFGGIVNGNCVAAFFTGAFTSGFGDRYLWQQTNNIYSTPTAVPSISNFQLYESGASVDTTYYFPPAISSRVCSGILLNFRVNPTNQSTMTNGVPYILFDTPQTIPAQQPISMKLRWYMNRL